MDPEYWIDFDLPCETPSDYLARARAHQRCVKAMRNAPREYDRGGVLHEYTDTKEWAEARSEFSRLTDKFLIAEQSAYNAYSKEYDASEIAEAKASFFKEIE